MMKNTHLRSPGFQICSLDNSAIKKHMALDNKMPKEIRQFFDLDYAIKMLDRSIALITFQTKQLQIGVNLTNKLEENFRILCEKKEIAQADLAKEMKNYKALRDYRRSLQQQYRLQLEQMQAPNQRPNDNSTDSGINSFLFHGGDAGDDGQAPLFAGFKSFDELFGPARDTSSGEDKEMNSVVDGSSRGDQMHSQAAAKETSNKQEAIPHHTSAFPFFSQRSSTPHFAMGNKGTKSFTQIFQKKN